MVNVPLLFVLKRSMVTVYRARKGVSDRHIPYTCAVTTRPPCG